MRWSNTCSAVYDRALDSNKEVAVTAGATAAILSSLMAFVESGDEVIVIEPFFVDGSAIDSIVTSTSSGSLAV